MEFESCDFYCEFLPRKVVPIFSENFPLITLSSRQRFTRGPLFQKGANFASEKSPFPSDPCNFPHNQSFFPLFCCHEEKTLKLAQKETSFQDFLIDTFSAVGEKKNSKRNEVFWSWVSTPASIIFQPHRKSQETTLNFKIFPKCERKRVIFGKTSSEKFNFLTFSWSKRHLFSTQNSKGDSQFSSQRILSLVWRENCHLFAFSPFFGSP